METLLALLAFFGLMGAALWLVRRHLLPRLARQEVDDRRLKRRAREREESDEPGHGHSRSDDSGDGGPDDGGD